MTNESSSGGKGCLFWGCLTLVILALLGMAGVGIMVFQVRKLAYSVTDTQPVDIPVAKPNEEEAEELKAKAEGLAEAVEQNRAKTFKFTENELNGLVAVLPDAKVLRGKAAFHIQGDTLQAEASVPLDQFPGMSGRYLNGKLALDVRCENGILEVFAKDVVVKGEPLPQQFREKLAQENLAKEIYNEPKAREALKNIDYIRVEDGKLIIRTRKKR